MYEYIHSLKKRFYFFNMKIIFDFFFNLKEFYRAMPGTSAKYFIKAFYG